MTRLELEPTIILDRLGLEPTIVLEDPSGARTHDHTRSEHANHYATERLFVMINVYH